MRPAINWLFKLTNFRKDIEIIIENNAYAHIKSGSTNGNKSDWTPKELNTGNLETMVSIEPIFIIKKEIMARPKNSINEIITKITDILIIKDESFFDIMENIDLINVSIDNFLIERSDFSAFFNHDYEYNWY